MSRYRKYLKRSFLSRWKATGWTHDFHIYQRKMSFKFAKRFAIISCSFVLILAIYNSFNHQENITNLRLIGRVFTTFITYELYVGVFLFIYRSLIRIINSIRVYGVNNISLIRIIYNLRKRQVEVKDIKEIDMSSIKINFAFRFFFKLKYFFFIAFNYSQSWNKYNKALFEIEETIGYKFNIASKFFINSLFFFFIGLLFIYLWYVNNYQIYLGFGLYLIFRTIFHFVRFFKPPSCMLLGTSKHSLSLLGILESSINYLGVSSLLTYNDIKIEEVYGVDNWNSFRTRDDVEWIDSVRKLVNIVPLIIIDGRHQSEAINNEVEYLFKLDPSDRLIFIIVRKYINEFIFENNSIEERMNNISNSDFLSDLVIKYENDYILESSSFKEYSKNTSNFEILTEDKIAPLLLFMSYSLFNNFSISNLLKFKQQHYGNLNNFFE